MKKYLGKVKQCIVGFTIAQFQQILREKNARADVLGKTTSANKIMGDQVKVQYILSIDIPKVNQIDEVANWTSLIVSYLKDGVLLEDREEARKLSVRAAKFVLKGEVLYKIGFSQPYLRCSNLDESFYMSMKESIKTIQGPCLPSIRQSAQDIIGHPCKQMLKVMSKRVISVNATTTYLSNHQSTSPQWWPCGPLLNRGWTSLVPFPMGTRQMKFLVVGIDYFTKWVEAEPLAKIIEQNVKSFVQKNIICRFGIPKVLVSDNGHQFDNTPFRKFCEQLGIRNHYSLPSHLQANGQAKVANQSLLKIIKTQLEGAKGIWPDELPSVLQAYKMTVRTQLERLLLSQHTKVMQ